MRRPRLSINRRPGSSALRLLLAGLLGVGAALLVSCGSSGNGLIPLQNAGPLESDFQAIAQAAQAGNGSCTETEATIHKAEQDLHGLPSTVDSGLRGRLEEGIANISAHARALCAQPPGTTTAGTTSTTKTSPPATATTTQPVQTTGTQATTPTSTAPAQTTSQPTGSEGGGTPAEGASQAPGVGASEGQPGEGGSNGAAGAPAGREGASSGSTGGTGGGQ